MGIQEVKMVLRDNEVVIIPGWRDTAEHSEHSVVTTQKPCNES